MADALFGFAGRLGLGLGLRHRLHFHWGLDVPRYDLLRARPAMPRHPTRLELTAAQKPRCSRWTTGKFPEAVAANRLPLNLAQLEQGMFGNLRLAAVGEGAVIRPPFHCDYGFNISLGAGVFLNFNCVILDVVEVTIGDKTQIGPGVQILTADHPRDAAGRASGLSLVAQSTSGATSG